MGLNLSRSQIRGSAFDPRVFIIDLYVVWDQQNPIYKIWVKKQIYLAPST